MAFSRIVYTYSGQSSFALNFTLGYISQDHVTCRINEEVDGLGDPAYRTLTWLTSNTVTIGGAALTNGDTITFDRTVPKDEVQHDYQDGALLIEDNLDESFLQAIMIAHEYLDGRIASFAVDLDMGNNKIINLADGVDDNDAANMSQINSVIGDATAQADAAATSASAAATSASAASTSQTAAASSASAASVSATAALAAQTALESGTFAFPSTGASEDIAIADRFALVYSPEDFGAVGDGVTNDDDAFTAMIAATSDGQIIQFGAGKTYLVDQVDFDTISNLVVLGNNAELKFTDVFSGSSACLSFRNCDDLLAYNLYVTEAGGYETGRSRLIRFIDCDRAKVYGARGEYDSQHLPEDAVDGGQWSLSADDRAITFQNCTDSLFYGLSTKNADCAMRAEDCTNCHFKVDEIDTYMKGFNAEDCSYCTFEGGYVHTMTGTFENYMRSEFFDWRKDHPGNNGVLIGGDSGGNYNTIKNWKIFDSGEHGMRLAGSADRIGWSVHDIYTENTGAAGLKILGEDTVYLRHSKIENIKAVDCIVGEENTLSASDGATSFVFDNATGTITITGTGAGAGWPENFGGDVTSITISGSSSNNNTYTVDSRDSDTVISVSGSTVTDETDSTPNTVVTWENEFKVSHGCMAYNVRNCEFANISSAARNETYACEDALSIHDAANCTFNHISGTNCLGAAVGFRPTNGGTYNDIDDIHITDVRAKNCAQGIYINHENITYNNLCINSAHIVDCTTGVLINNSGSTPGSIGNNCFIEAHFNDNTTNYDSDKDNVLLHFSGDVDSTKDVNARDGSLWQDHGDTLYVLYGSEWLPVVLDKEGDFSPILTDSGGNEPTYSVNEGYYIRQGNMVHVFGRIAVTALGSLSGSIRLGDLPFDVKSSSSKVSMAGRGFGRAQNITGYTGLSWGNFSTSTDQVVLYVGDGSTALDASMLTTSTHIRFAFSYPIA